MFPFKPNTDESNQLTRQPLILAATAAIFWECVSIVLYIELIETLIRSRLLFKSLEACLHLNLWFWKCSIKREAAVFLYSAGLLKTSGNELFKISSFDDAQINPISSSISFWCGVTIYSSWYPPITRYTYSFFDNTFG